MSRETKILHRPFVSEASKLNCCPMCGQAMPIAGVPEGVHLTPLQTRIFEILRLASTVGITVDELHATLYPGEPVSMRKRKSIHVHIHCVRNKLEPHGWVIKSTYGPGATYTLKHLNGANQ